MDSNCFHCLQSVISGFTSAAAISIASTQLKGLLGLSYTANGFLDEISGAVKHISDTQWKDALVAFISLISLYVLMVGNFQSVVI
jgi:sodium-independent sulfate anion transporter 11